MDLVRVNVGGTLFLISRQHLGRFAGSTLTVAISEGGQYDEVSGCHIFDRNPEHFNSILDCYRLGHYHLCQNTCAVSLKAAFDYWKLPFGIVSSCCIRTILEGEEKVSTLTVMKEEILGPLHKYRREMKTSKGWEKLKLKIWLFAEHPRYSIFAKIWSIVYAVLVLLSCAILAVLTDNTGNMYQLSDLSPENQKRCHSIKYEKYIGSQAIYCNYVGVIPLQILDLVLNLIFTFDLIVRMVVCPSKSIFFKSFMNWLDLLTIVSFYTSGLIVLLGEGIWIEENGISLFTATGICFALQGLRLIRLLKISRWVLGLRVFGLIIRRSVYSLLTIVWLLGMGAVFFAFFAYIVDINSKEEGLSRVSEGLYLAFITITTVGYGDVVPTSIGSRIICSSCAVLGIILAGLSIPILASSFNLYFAYISQYMRSDNKITIDWLGFDNPAEEDVSQVWESEKSETESPASSSKTDLDQCRGAHQEAAVNE